MVTVYNDQQDLKIDTSQVEALVSAVLEPFQVQDVIIHFIDHAKMCKLHQKHFDDPSPTDCISFPIDLPGPDCQVLGEIFVCPHTAILYAQKNKLDPYRECSLYIVHGLLHLLGYDDITSDQQKKIRAMESQSLNFLDERGLILTAPEC